MRTRARIHSGLRSRDRQPARSTPAAASRARLRGTAHRRPPAPRRGLAPAERGEVGGPLAPRPRPGARPRRAPPLDGPGDERVDDLAHRDASTPSAASDVTGLVGDAARDDVVEHGEVGVDVEGEAVHRPAPGRAARRWRRSCGAGRCRRRPTRRGSRRAGRPRRPRSAERVDHQLLDRARRRRRCRRLPPPPLRRARCRIG